MVGKTEGEEKPKTVGSQFAKIPKPGNPKTYKNFNYAKTSACNQALTDSISELHLFTQQLLLWVMGIRAIVPSVINPIKIGVVIAAK